MKAVKLLLIAFLGFAFNTLVAQDNKGDDFWLSFQQNLTGTGHQLSFLITSDVNTTGNISIAGISFNQNFSVTAGNITTVVIPLTAEITTLDAVSNRGIHITSNDDITVYGLNARNATTDAYLGFPTDALGKEYIVLAYKNVNILNAVQFAIVAAETGTTTVTITPSVTTGARTAGVPYNITLTQGQTYMLRNTVNANDLTGTIISSDKNIAVFGGHQCANIPNGGTYGL